MLRLTFKIKKDVTKDTLLNEICSKNRININIEKRRYRKRTKIKKIKYKKYIL